MKLVSLFICFVLTMACKPREVPVDPPSVANAASLTQDANHYYVFKPLRDVQKEMFGRESEKSAEAINYTMDLLIEKTKTVPNTRSTEEFLKAVRDVQIASKETLAETITLVREAMPQVANTGADSGIEFADFLPSGYMLIVAGVNIDGYNSFIGGGGSTAFALVIVPIHVTRIKKWKKEGEEKPETIKYWTFSWNIVNLSVANVGAGGENAVGLRYGIGLIFKELNHASDFFGWAVGLSGKLAIGHHGINGKLLCLKGKTGFCHNVFATVTYQRKLTPQTPLSYKIHGNVGGVIPVKNIVASIYKAFVTNAQGEEKQYFLDRFTDPDVVANQDTQWIERQANELNDENSSND